MTLSQKLFNTVYVSGKELKGGENGLMTALKKKTGFTLIELLIVMAILGVLAVVVLVAINPVQQLARTRDSGRKSTITQVGHALEAYFTGRGGNYIDETATPLWLGALKIAGELSVEPSTIAIGVTTAGIVPCNGVLGGGTGVEENEWCYKSTGADGSEPAVVYTALESDSEISKCDSPLTTPFFVWSTADGRGGLVCTNGLSEPEPGGQVWNLTQ